MKLKHSLTDEQKDELIDSNARHTSLSVLNQPLYDRIERANATMRVILDRNAYAHPETFESAWMKINMVLASIMSQEDNLSDCEPFVDAISILESLASGRYPTRNDMMKLNTIFERFR